MLLKYYVEAKDKRIEHVLADLTSITNDVPLSSENSIDYAISEMLAPTRRFIEQILSSFLPDLDATLPTTTSIEFVIFIVNYLICTLRLLNRILIRDSQLINKSIANSKRELGLDATLVCDSLMLFQKSGRFNLTLLSDNYENDKPMFKQYAELLIEKNIQVSTHFLDQVENAIDCFKQFLGTRYMYTNERLKIDPDTLPPEYHAFVRAFDNDNQSKYNNRSTREACEFDMFTSQLCGAGVDDEYNEMDLGGANTKKSGAPVEIIQCFESCDDKDDVFSASCFKDEDFGCCDKDDERTVEMCSSYNYSVDELNEALNKLKNIHYGDLDKITYNTLTEALLARFDKPNKTIEKLIRATTANLCERSPIQTSSYGYVQKLIFMLKNKIDTMFRGLSIVTRQQDMYIKACDMDYALKMQIQSMIGFLQNKIMRKVYYHAFVTKAIVPILFDQITTTDLFDNYFNNANLNIPNNMLLAIANIYQTVPEVAFLRNVGTENSKFVSQATQRHISAFKEGIESTIRQTLLMMLSCKDKATLPAREFVGSRDKPQFRMSYKPSNSSEFIQCFSSLKSQNLSVELIQRNLDFVVTMSFAMKQEAFLDYIYANCQNNIVEESAFRRWLLIAYVLMGDISASTKSWPQTIQIYVTHPKLIQLQKMMQIPLEVDVKQETTNKLIFDLASTSANTSTLTTDSIKKIKVCENVDAPIIDAQDFDNNLSVKFQILSNIDNTGIEMNVFDTETKSFAYARMKNVQRVQFIF